MPSDDRAGGDELIGDRPCRCHADRETDALRLADTATSLVAEARRLNTLAVPAVIRYCKGDGTETITWTGPWTEARLSRMVKNPIHKGEHIHKSRPGGRNRPVQTEIPQSFEPLVDASTWERANARLAANRRWPQGNEVRKGLLSGMIRCGVCGHTYQQRTDRGRNGRWHRYYYCAMTKLRSLPLDQRDRATCPAKLVPADQADGAVWSTIEAFLQDPGPVLKRAWV